MSNLIVVLGESGTGKSTSMRNLKPESTYIINVLNKPLPFRGYSKFYSLEKKNYFATDSYQVILNHISSINERALHINAVVVDDFSFLMNNEFMRRCKEKGYDKFTDMGNSMFEFMKTCENFRDDLYVFIMCHTEKDHSGLIKPKTVGKMTSDYVGIAERVTTALHTQIVDGQFRFLTQNNGIHMAKSPMGLFDDLLIDNDLQLVIDNMKSYYEGE